MLSHVVLIAWSMGERLTTVVAHVGFFTFMLSHMSLQIPFLCKFFRTDLTLVSFLLVDFGVEIKVRFVVKSLPAGFTDVCVELTPVRMLQVLVIPQGLS